MKIKVGVLFGGPSCEHEISIITAVQAAAAIDKEKYEVIPIYIGKDREWYTGSNLLNIDNYKDMDLLKNCLTNVILYNKNNEFILQRKNGLFKTHVNKLDFILPILHGFNTEDGTIAGYLETIGIPYAFSDIYASVIGQDKVFQKQILEAAKIPVIPYIWFNDFEYLNDENKIISKIEKLTYPVIVKPARLGSSIGITVAKNKEELKNALEEAIKYDEKILVEKALTDFLELNCSVLGSLEDAITSVVEEVSGEAEMLTFNDKYMNSNKSKGIVNTNRIIPARISDKETKKIENHSIDAFKVIGASGVVRIDYLMDKKTKKIYLNELNTIPGSLSFYLWKDKGINYTELLSKIIDLGVKRYYKKKKKASSFETNILKNFGGLKGNKGNKF